MSHWKGKFCFKKRHVLLILNIAVRVIRVRSNIGIAVVKKISANIFGKIYICKVRGK